MTFLVVAGGIFRDWTVGFLISSYGKNALFLVVFCCEFEECNPNTKEGLSVVSSHWTTLWSPPPPLPLPLLSLQSLYAFICHFLFPPYPTWRLKLQCALSVEIVSMYDMPKSQSCMLFIIFSNIFIAVEIALIQNMSINKLVYHINNYMHKLCS